MEAEVRNEGEKSELTSDLHLLKEEQIVTFRSTDFEKKGRGKKEGEFFGPPFSSLRGDQAGVSATSSCCTFLSFSTSN